MPLSVPGLPGLPPDLAGPVAVELAKPVRSIPPEGALPGGCVYEPKWDCYRLVVVRDGASTRLWSKQGRDLTALFPEIAASWPPVPPTCAAGPWRGGDRRSRTSPGGGRRRCSCPPPPPTGPRPSAGSTTSAPPAWRAWSQGRGHPLRAGPTGVAQGQVLGDHGGA